MKRLKILIIVVMVISLYAENDLFKWLGSGPTNRVVYAHFKLKGKKHWLHKTLVAKRPISKVKKI